MWKKAGLIFLKITLLIAILTGLLVCAVWLGVFGHLKNRKELLAIENATATRVLSKDGELIGKFFTENRTNISFGQIPPYLNDALIATEDIRYFKHKGIDTRSILRVLFKTVLFNQRSSGGGSTITQQLAKNLFGRKSFGPLTLPVNKAKEAILARRLEKVFSKAEILTLYLNTVSFGENVYGIEAASGRYFNKKTQDLTLEESAVLIGMLKANTFYNPRLNPENATRRRNLVLRQMEKYHFLESAKTDSLCNLPLMLDYSNTEARSPAGYFLFQVKNETEQILQKIYTSTGTKWNPEIDGLVITTTLDHLLQRYALQAFQEHLPVMQKRLETQYKTAFGKELLEGITRKEMKRLNIAERANDTIEQRIFSWEGPYPATFSVKDSLKNALTMLHAGLLAMDPHSGAVRAWVGGIDFNTQPYDQVLARRQLASTFKPILYAAALEDGMDPCTYLDNDSIIIDGFDEWSPRNFDHTYGGKYSLSGALVKSMNVPTFNLLHQLGYEKLDILWQKLGFSFPLSNTPSLALGTAEANIRELALAYAAFANGGYTVKPQTIVSIKTPDGEVIYQNPFDEIPSRVLSIKTSQLMSSILERAVWEGTGASMRSIYGVTLPAAGKTGTSQNYADAWFAAFNPKLVIISRVGASTGAIHFNSGSYGSGSALALPLVALTLKKAQQDPALAKQFMTPFPELIPEWQAELDCPDFAEKDFMDKLFDLFEKDKIIYGKDKEQFERKARQFFKRLFKRK